ncbi:hypothetical protein [Hymenobacter sp. AT01-02]|uniref:hypothetical protein n=1 Tax=Hymenobacter sp. AT01-02 TaxID=1571877 RepID=UPI000AE33985|nr:hypothetical protein [Hymenobacter sp. AT01-02]
MQKRLALHYAPHEYRLTIIHDPETYIHRVALTIRLAPLALTPTTRPAPSFATLASTP